MPSPCSSRGHAPSQLMLRTVHRTDAQDLAANLYESYYINFLAPVPGALLNHLAAASVQADAVVRVSKVRDSSPPAQPSSPFCHLSSPDRGVSPALPHRSTTST